jgi:hypothetical protein
MRQVLSFQLDSCDVKPVLYYDEPALCCDDDDVSVFILIHIDADDDGIPLRMMMLPMKKTSMIYRYASQDDIDDVVLPLDAVDDAVLSLSHDAAEEYPSC